MDRRTQLNQEQSDNFIIELHLSGENEMINLGSRLAGSLLADDCILISGDLGAGKTFLSRAVIHTLMNDKEYVVTSPTFNLMQEYNTVAGVKLYHYDLYRLEHEDEILQLGFEELIEGSISLVEWPEKSWENMPENSLHIQIFHSGDNSRQLNICGNEKWKGRLSEIINCS